MRSTLSRVRGSLLTGESFRGMGVIMAGSGGAQIMVIAAQPILTRLYLPADYGVFAVALAILAIVGSIETLRYRYAIPIASDDRAAANLFVLCIGTAVLVTALSSVLLTLILPMFATDTADWGPYVPLLAVALFLGGITGSFGGLATRRKAYSLMAQSNVAASIGRLATQIILGSQGFGAAGLITGLAGGSIASSIRYALRDLRPNLQLLGLVSRGGVVDVAKRYRRFPLLSAPSALLNAFGLQLPLLMFVALYGAEEGGLMALAIRVIGFPVVLVSLAVGQTYHADAAQAIREDPFQVRDVFLRTTKTLALLASAPTILAIVLSPLLFGTIFGDEWAEAGLYVSVLAPMYYLLSVFSPTGSTLDVLERQELHLVREIFRILLLGGVIAVCAVSGLPALATVLAISVTGCVVYIIYGAISWRAIVSAERKLSV